jgi:hypothetical protein
MVDRRLFCLIFIVLFISLELPGISSRKNLIARTVSDFVEYKPLSFDPPFFQVGSQVAVFLNLKFYLIFDSWRSGLKHFTALNLK